jgi:hypothetical protein
MISGMSSRMMRELGATGGVILRRDAIAGGLNDRVIARHVSNQIWHKVRRGAYVDRPLWDSLDPADHHRILARAVLRTSECPAVLSHLSAAVEHGADTWDLDLSQVHLTREDMKAGRHEAGVHQHRGRIGPDEVTERDGVPVVRAARAAVEVTTLCDAERGLVVMNSLLHAGATDLGDIKSVAAALDRWPDTLSTRIVIGLADPRIESVGESRTAYMLWSQGLPYFEPQYKIRDSNGRVVARVDFALPNLGVFLEFDGMQKYLELRGEKSLDQVMLEERQRERLVCRLTGWVCIRITWADLAHPERIAREIRSVLLSRRPTAG